VRNSRGLGTNQSVQYIYLLQCIKMKGKLRIIVILLQLQVLRI